MRREFSRGSAALLRGLAGFGQLFDGAVMAFPQEAYPDQRAGDEIHQVSYHPVMRTQAMSRWSR